MKRTSMLILFCFTCGVALASPTPPYLPEPIPAKVDIKIHANMKKDAIVYSPTDDDILMTVSADNSLSDEMQVYSVTYDVYLSAKQNNTLLPPVYVGSGSMTLGSISPTQEPLSVPAGASAGIAGNDVFSGITTFPYGTLYPFINSESLSHPHPVGVYTVIVHFTGVIGRGTHAKNVYSETSIGFGINNEATLN